jgi:hypothetical protein
MKSSRFFPALAWVLAATLFAQDNNSAAPLYPDTAHPVQVPTNGQDAAPSRMNENTGQNSDIPLFRVSVYGRTAKAVNYRHRGGSTTVDFRGTQLMPAIQGHAKVDGKAGRLQISAELTHMQPATSLEAQYLTYVFVGNHSRRSSRKSRRNPTWREWKREN